MHSYEEWKKAVFLYMKYGRSLARAVRMLGYTKWVQAYLLALVTL
ncbi:hypothetical protein [uncultured Sphaerochaeta sp.]|nr:hypothetical protein [uncultured Sphaerochaeta sp.]